MLNRCLISLEGNILEKMAKEGSKPKLETWCIYIYIYIYIHHNGETTQHYNNDKFNVQLSRSVRGL
jgi:hypothetical protein